MEIIMTTAALVSALALGALVDSIAAKAQDAEPQMQECMGENCPRGGGMQDGEEQGVTSKRMRKPDAQVGDQDGEAMPRRPAKLSDHLRRWPRHRLSERFNRVRVVECNGGTYTYLGRRQGDTYCILLNARTGRIVGRTLI